MWPKTKPEQGYVTLKNFLSFIWRSHRKAGLALGAALIALTFFVGDFVADTLYFANPANQERPLELWMSPRFVGKSWGIPKHLILSVMEMDPNGSPRHGPHTLADVLEQTGMSLDELEARIVKAQQDMQGHHGK